MEAKNASGTAALLNDLIEKASSVNASDIHIEPFQYNIRIRYRIDGILRIGLTIHQSMHQPMISRIKVISDLDIAEQRLPQDGKFFYKAKDRELDVRVSVIPTIFGEKAVLRLLPRNSPLLPLESLGMPKKELAAFKHELERTQGLIIVCGPTGCGKTTTLYSALDKLDREKLNIVTIEDPVEYQMAGINQIQVNNKSGMTFSKGLRGILRQDPDVILLGEIRDGETAKIAVQASMTGHLVFSTLHTNDVLSAKKRLVDLGVEEYLIEDTLVAVLSQRLVRKICVECRGKGCKICGQTGLRGRTGVFELYCPKRQGTEYENMAANARRLAEEGVVHKEEIDKILNSAF